MTIPSADIPDWAPSFSTGQGGTLLQQQQSVGAGGNFTFGPVYVGNVEAVAVILAGAANQTWQYVTSWLQSDHASPLTSVGTTGFMGSDGVINFTLVNAGPFFSVQVFNTGAGLGSMTCDIFGMLKFSSMAAMATNRIMATWSETPGIGSDLTHILSPTVAGPAVISAIGAATTNVNTYIEYWSGAAWTILAQYGGTRLADGFSSTVALPPSTCRIRNHNGAVAEAVIGSIVSMPT